MKVTWKRIVFGVIVSGLFIYLTIRGLDWEQVFEHLKTLNPLWFGLTVFFTFVAMYLRGVRWAMLLSPYKKIPSLYLFSIELVGYMVNYLLPGKLGEVVKSYVADEDRNISKGVVFGTVVVERILDLAFILLLGVFLPTELKARVPVVKKISIGALILLFVVLGGILIMHQFREKLTQKDYRGWIGKVMLSLEKFSHGLDVIGSPSVLLRAFIVTALVWFFTFLQLYVLMPGMGIRPDMALSLFAMFLFTLGITIPSSPGDIGPFHYFITIALVSGGIQKDLAFAYAVVYHLSQFITVVPSGILIFLTKGLSWKEVK